MLLIPKCLCPFGLCVSCLSINQLDRRTPSDLGLLWAIYENIKSSFHFSGASSCVSGGRLFVFCVGCFVFPWGVCVVVPCSVLFRRIVICLPTTLLLLLTLTLTLTLTPTLRIPCHALRYPIPKKVPHQYKSRFFKSQPSPCELYN
jgi:hypothetical protein